MRSRPTLRHHLAFLTLVLVGVFVASSPVGAETPATVFDVTMFGAIPDDDGDDTAAIRAALAAAREATAPVVHLPAGRYRIMPQDEDETAALLLRQSGLTLRGEGPERTILEFATLGGADPATNWYHHRGNAEQPWRGYGIEFSPDEPLHNLTLRDFRLTGNAPPTGKVDWVEPKHRAEGWDISHKGVMLGNDNRTENIHLLNLYVDNWRGELIYGAGTNHGRVVIMDCRAWGTNGSAISLSADLVVTGCEVWDAANACIESFHHGNGAIRRQHAIYRNNILTPRKTLQSAGFHGIVIATWPGASILVEGNTIRHAQYNGVFIVKHAENITIRNNDFEDCGQGGNLWHGYIALAPDPWQRFKRPIQNILIEGNQAVHKTSATAGFFLWVGSPSYAIYHNIRIKDNVVLAPEGSGRVQTFYTGAAEHEHTEVSRIVISGNTGNGVRWIADDRSTESTSLPVWSGNDFRNIETEGNPAVYAATPGESILDIAPDGPQAVITRVPHARYPVVWGQHLHRYPDGFVLSVTYRPEPSARGKSLLIPADSSWNTFAEPVLVGPGESVAFRKEEGRFALTSEP